MREPTLIFEVLTLANGQYTNHHRLPSAAGGAAACLTNVIVVAIATIYKIVFHIHNAKLPITCKYVLCVLYKLYVENVL